MADYQEALDAVTAAENKVKGTAVMIVNWYL